jgi:hypothetical protein
MRPTPCLRLLAVFSAAIDCSSALIARTACAGSCSYFPPLIQAVPCSCRKAECLPEPHIRALTSDRPRAGTYRPLPRSTGQAPCDLIGKVVVWADAVVEGSTRPLDLALPKLEPQAEAPCSYRWQATGSGRYGPNLLWEAEGRVVNPLLTVCCSPSALARNSHRPFVSAGPLSVLIEHSQAFSQCPLLSHPRHSSPQRQRPAEAGRSCIQKGRLRQAVTPFAASAYSSIWSKFMYL